MRSARRYLVVAILALHAALLAWLAARHSPTIHEMAHLPAGLCHWQFGMFELYRVNPPLPRMVAALPVLFCQPRTDWGNYQFDALSRITIPMGIRFAEANGARTIFLFMIARWACIPFCLLGGWVCYRWACELWRRASGLAALCLWCFNPMILGHGAVVMPDVPAAALGVFAAWRFWKWLREPAWPAAALAGLALGLAELCKTTLLVFFILWPVAWLVGQAFQPDARQAGKPDLRCRSGWQLITILLLAIYIINLGYAFKGSFQRLGDYRFQSRALSGQPPADPPGNRFAGTWLARLRVPLPRDYVQGIDCQRNDFEVGGRSYLHGRWAPRGWWYYYLVGLGIKTPLGTLAALLVTVVLSVGNALRGVPPLLLPLPPGEGRGEGGSHHETAGLSRRVSGRDEVFLLAPAITILALVSSQTGFSAHVRYAIPALPCLFIWCGKLAAGGVGVGWAKIAQQSQAHQRRSWWARARKLAWPTLHAVPRLRFGFLVLCLVATAVESLSVYPHSLSFFNRLIGGPRHGHEWLLDSNGAWGQDLVFLKEWIDRHPEARPLRLAAVGWLDPQAIGIDYAIPRVGPSHPISAEDRARIGHRSHHAPRDGGHTTKAAVMRAGSPARQDSSHHAERDDYGVPQTWDDVRSLDDLAPQPGWYVIDVNFLHGTDWAAHRPDWLFQKIAEQGLNYEYFRRFEPCDQVAYSYLIYQLTRADANRVRDDLNLPPHSRRDDD